MRLDTYICLFIIKVYYYSVHERGSKLLSQT